jgi:signal transduction histidine kinase
MVECIKGSESLILRFSDTGTAIPNEILPQLFQKFSTNSANDPTIQGAGLGLFICREIINAHGGKISAKNNPEGAGATLEVNLPLYTLQEYDPNITANQNI